MALDNCSGSIRTAIGRDLTKDEKVDVTREAKAIMARLAHAGDDPAEKARIMQEVSDRGAVLKARTQRDAALQWQKLEARNAQRRSVAFAVKNPAEWLKGFFRGSTFKYFGSKDSLAVDVQREGNRRAEGLHAELYKNGVHDFADSKSLSVKRQINNALWNLRNGKSLAEVKEKFGNDAAMVADIFNRHSELTRRDLNDAGAWIGQNSDRTFRRTHDGNKIAKAGGGDYGSTANRDYWVTQQYKRMNWYKAFDGTLAGSTEKERTDLLRKEWGTMVSGQHIDFTNDYGHGARGRAGQRFSYQRKLVFKSADDDLAYNEEYGKGSTLLENKTSEMRESGKVLALLQKLGPRPEENLKRFVNQWIEELKSTDPIKAQALGKRLDSEMRNTWRLLTGQVGHPSDSFVNRLEASARHTLSTAKTGLSIFSLPSDLGLRASHLADYSGGRLRGSVLAQIANFGDAAANLSKEDKKWLMAQVGSRWEDATRPMDPNLVDHQGFGALYHYNGIVSNLQGHAAFDNTFRTASLANDGNLFAREMDQKFANVTLKEGLERFGIGDADWEVLRKMETSKLGDGRSVLMPQNILDAPLEKFQTLTNIKEPSEAALRRVRAELAAKYRNILGELSERSSSATSLENQARMGLGNLNHDSKYFIPVRWALQLKGWGMNYIYNHLDRELRGHYTDYVTVGHAMRDMMLGRNTQAITGLSKLIGKGMAIAYVTNAARQMAMGQTPGNPFDFDSEKYGGFFKTPGAEAAMGAFAKQGLGLYSDWILAQGAPNENIQEKVFDMLGPVPETAANIADLGRQAFGQDAKTGGMSDEQKGRDLQRLYGIGWKLIPGTQSWYSKAAGDALIYNTMSESLNPGYKDRLQKRAQARGQSYWNQ